MIWMVLVISKGGLRKYTAILVAMHSILVVYQVQDMALCLSNYRISSIIDLATFSSRNIRDQRIIEHTRLSGRQNLVYVHWHSYIWTISKK